MKIEFGLSNYATNVDLTNATGVDTSKFANRVDLESLKYKLKNIPNNLRNFKGKVEKLDVDKIVPPAVELSKLSDLAKMTLLKKMYIMLR